MGEIKCLKNTSTSCIQKLKICKRLNRGPVKCKRRCVAGFRRVRTRTYPAVPGRARRRRLPYCAWQARVWQLQKRSTLHRDLRDTHRACMQSLTPTQSVTARLEHNPGRFSFRCARNEALGFSIRCVYPCRLLSQCLSDPYKCRHRSCHSLSADKLGQATCRTPWC